MNVPGFNLNLSIPMWLCWRVKGYNYNHDRPHMALGGVTPKQWLVMTA